jgi:MFS family permease
MAAPAVQPPRLFHGWVVVGAAFVVLFIGFGVAYSFAAFFHSLRDEFDATRGDVSLVFAITGFLYFTLGAVSGPLADRLGPQRVILAGVASIAAGLALASAAQALWQVYLTYSLGVGVGVGLVYVPAVGAVQRWFSRRRGMASGMAVSGIGAGTLALPLVAAGAIDLWDWRIAYALLGGLALVAGIPAALMVEHSPDRRGLHPDGDTTPAGARSSAAWGLATREALRSRPFWLLYAACFATAIGLFIPFAHLSPYAEDHGFSDGFGALLVGLIGVGSTGGRLVLGGSADRMGRRVALAGTFATMALALLGWLGATQAWSLIVFALVFGTAYGGFVALLPALATDYLGQRNAGAIIGFLYTSAGVGALVGPVVAGAVYDALDSYTLPIMLGAIANALAVGCMLVLPDPAHWQAASPGDERQRIWTPQVKSEG